MAEKLPQWDLSVFYKGINDPQIKKDFDQTLAMATGFAKKYKGKIDSKLSAAKLARLLNELESIYELYAKYGYYSYLQSSLHNNDPVYGSFYQKIQTDSQQVGNTLVFFELELGNLPEDKIRGFIKAPELSNYKHYLQRVLDYKPHRLTEPEEKILNLKYLTSRAALVRLFDQIISSKKFKVKVGRLVKEVLSSEIISMLQNKDRSMRKAAADAYTAGLKEELSLFTFILNMLMQDQQLVDGLRRYKKPEDPRHLDNEMSSADIEAMCAAVSKNYSLFQKYYAFKQKALGLKQLNFYDRMAPYPMSSNKKFTFEEIRKLILTGFEAFDKEYRKHAEKFFEEGRIDAPVRSGKTTGAFCCGITPKLPPFILMNFQGNLEDVATLAHELGHGVNDVLMQKQSLFNYGVPTVTAEIASIFSEMVLFSHLMQSDLSTKEKFILLTDKIEDLAGNIFRGVSVYEFEREIHYKRRQGNELTSEDISQTWIKHQSKAMGKQVILKGGYEVWWSYIGHFYHFSPPFYYYGYAFGALSALVFYSKYLEEGREFIDKYLNFLSLGTSVSPKEALKTVGLDPEDSKMWQKGLSVFESLVKQAQNLHKKIEQAS
jgi:oligoendopeptidase F